MIEMFAKPKRAERKPFEMFWVGLLYSSISLLLISFVFSKDSILSQYGGILVVTFTVICSLPFMYYIIKLEENKDVEINESGKLLKEHSKAIHALMWLFLGFVVGFSFWYLVLPEQTGPNFNAQIETFCAINSPHSFDNCVNQYGFSHITGGATSTDYISKILENNISVLVFTLLFSIIFGAGAIFILVWNASVIAVAVGSFAQNSLLNLPSGLLRYMIHGVPEIAAYFVGALAGGIVSVAVIRRDLVGERKWRILQDALTLVIIAVAILFIAALIEVFVTPSLFN